MTAKATIEELRELNHEMEELRAELVRLDERINNAINKLNKLTEILLKEIEEEKAA